MICINLRKRSRKYKVIFYCKAKRKEITLDKCKECKYKEYKEVKKIKKKSKKLIKLEKERDKDIKKSGVCEYCGKFSRRLDPHEVYGGSNRKRSIKHKFVKLICSECHENEKTIMKLRIDVQKEYEKTHTREEFISIVGKSYI